MNNIKVVLLVGEHFPCSVLLNGSAHLLKIPVAQNKGPFGLWGISKFYTNITRSICRIESLIRKCDQHNCIVFIIPPHIFLIKRSNHTVGPTHIWVKSIDILHTKRAFILSGSDFQ